MLARRGRERWPSSPPPSSACPRSSVSTRRPSTEASSSTNTRAGPGFAAGTRKTWAACSWPASTTRSSSIARRAGRGRRPPSFPRSRPASPPTRTCRSWPRNPPCSTGRTRRPPGHPRPHGGAPGQRAAPRPARPAHGGRARSRGAARRRARHPAAARVRVPRERAHQAAARGLARARAVARSAAIAGRAQLGLSARWSCCSLSASSPSSMMAALRSPSSSRDQVRLDRQQAVEARPGSGRSRRSRCCGAARTESSSPAASTATPSKSGGAPRRRRARRRARRSRRPLAQLVADELEQEAVELVEALDLAAHRGAAHALGVGLRLLAARRGGAACPGARGRARPPPTAPTPCGRPRSPTGARRRRSPRGVISRRAVATRSSSSLCRRHAPRSAGGIGGERVAAGRGRPRRARMRLQRSHAPHALHEQVRGGHAQHDHLARGQVALHELVVRPRPSGRGCR